MRSRRAIAALGAATLASAMALGDAAATDAPPAAAATNAPAAADAKAAAGSQPQPQPLLLPPGATVEIACATQAVLVATGAANATNGELRLRLERTTEPGQDGRWTPLGESGAHAASLATLHAKTCAKGCPFTIGKDDDVQLWAPAPKGLDKLGGDELLTLAVIKSATQQLKASTFRGQQIEALESGTCRRDDQAVSVPAEQPPASPPKGPGTGSPIAPAEPKPDDASKGTGPGASAEPAAVALDGASALRRLVMAYRLRLA